LREGGALSVITSKFLGLRRAVLPIAAGSEGFSLGMFVPASVVSALLWSGVLLLPGIAIRAFTA
jgi:membrane protein DedA with SNARE-associated domain